MSRAALERGQVWLYLAAVAAGLWVGTAAPAVGPAFETALWPALAALLFATFTQIPLTDLPAAFRDRRFLAATLGGNFVLVPLLVAALLWLTPDDPAIRLGVAMVLLVPCTDWFITFAHLAGGDARLAVAITPVSLLLQFALLPLGLWLLLGAGLAPGPMLAAGATAFLGLIVAPLALAAALTLRARGNAARTRRLAALGAAPVPLLALVVFLIAGAQAEAALAAAPALGPVVAVFALFAVAAAALGAALARGLGLPRPQGVTLIFALVTRNSFVVLPLALALPAGMAVAAIVIVIQSLVELLAVLALTPLARRLAGPGAAGG